ncbi:MAG: hypothetical protein RLY66_109 [Candidatus Parcubacteria bacterium]
MIFVYAVYGYMRHRISVSLNRVIESRQLVAERDLSLQKQDSLAALYSESTPDRSEARGLFVPENSTISFIESIEALGSSSGSIVQLSAIEADPPVVGSTIGRIRVHVEAQGSWWAVMKTVMLAEDLPYGVSIKNLRIDSSSGQGSKDEAAWKASFAIEALMMKPVTKAQP